MKKHKDCYCGECDVCTYNQNVEVKVVEVSQFFEFKNMTWKQLMGTKDKGVLPSTDNKVFLWTETPKIMLVNNEENPNVGSVWLKEGPKNTIEVFKTNYDTSD